MSVTLNIEHYAIFNDDAALGTPAWTVAGAAVAERQQKKKKKKLASKKK